MPLYSFANGKQLVSLVLDALRSKFSAPQSSVVILMIDYLAHLQAATNPQTRLLHCDVSGGNIFIYPQIVDTGGERVLMWMGILGDWELAKDTRVLKQTQPERTVSHLWGHNNVLG